MLLTHTFFFVEVGKFIKRKNKSSLGKEGSQVGCPNSRLLWLGCTCHSINIF
jgi:hypothetical protein